MIILLGAIFSLYIISFGYGALICDKLNLSMFHCKSAIGFVTLLALCQCTYFPIQFFNLSFKFIALFTALILLGAIILCIKYRRLLFEQFKNKRYLWVMTSAILFCLVFYFCFIDIEFSDSPMYLNYVAQNINNDTLNLFHLYTGKVGAEWDTIYLYQGYYHFIGAILYFVNLPHYLWNATPTVATLAGIVWGFGLLYQLVSSSFIVDMVDDFHINNKLVKVCITIFTLFYTNFYYWKVAFAYYGNTWRSLLIWVVLWVLVKFAKDTDNKSYPKLLFFILFAGCASSSSFFFISFELMFCFFVYLLIIKKENVISIMANSVVPIVIYACVMLYKGNSLTGIACACAAIAYYLFRNQRIVSKWISIVETIVFKYAKVIFFVLVPVGLIAISVLIKTKDPNYIYDLSYWAQDHQNYDMVKDYRFVYANIIDNCLNVLRYLGIAILIFKHKGEYLWIKVLYAFMLVCFLNPFATVAISRLLTGNVFYRAIEIIFNPYTETLLVLLIIQWINKPIVNGVLSLSLVGISAIGHVASFTNNELGLYTFYVEGGKDVDPIAKLTKDELDIIEKFTWILDHNGRIDSNDGMQITVISQANGLRVYEPSIYQVFTARDYFYPFTRIDNDFYMLATNHYDWIEYPQDLDYSKTCDYFYQYGVNYVIVKYEPYYQNYQFDQASDGCSVTLTQNDTYKIKQVIVSE